MYCPCCVCALYMSCYCFCVSRCCVETGTLQSLIMSWGVIIHCDANKLLVIRLNNVYDEPIMLRPQGSNNLSYCKAKHVTVIRTYSKHVCGFHNLSYAQWRIISIKFIQFVLYCGLTDVYINYSMCYGDKYNLCSSCSASLLYLFIFSNKQLV